MSIFWGEDQSIFEMGWHDRELFQVFGAYNDLRTTEGDGLLSHELAETGVHKNELSFTWNRSEKEIELRYFLDVAKLENIHKASEKLNVSPASLSDLPPKKWTQFTQPWRASRTLPARDNPELSVDVPGCTTSQSMRRSPV